MISVTEENYLKKIPEECGVYLFHGEDQVVPLYIGKSVNIRKRIKSHFYNTKTDKRELKLMKQTRYIDWQTTSGELGALLLESCLIKTKMPLANKRLRRTKKIYTYTLREGKYLSLTLQCLSNEMFQINDNCYGLFRSQKRATEMLESTIQEYKLCRKVLGLEKGGNVCFAYQIKRCLGACAGKETETQHNTRLIDALNQYQLAMWPYRGAIGLLENNSNDKQVVYFIKDWMLLGEMPYSENMQLDWRSFSNPKSFDLDMYRIIFSALHDEKNQLSIIEECT